MESKQQSFTLRLEIGPGIPFDLSAFHQPQAFQAVLAAIFRSMTPDVMYADSVYTASSGGITAHVNPIRTNVGATGSIPSTFHCEVEGTVAIEGEEMKGATFPIRHLTFPIERGQLEDMKAGQRKEAVIPAPQFVSRHLRPGEKVTFLEATADPFGNPVYVPGGESLTVALTQVTDQKYLWAGQNLYLIAWEPEETAHVTAATDAHASGGVESGGRR